MKTIRTLIVDDSAVIRRLYTELLSDAADIEVIGVAVDAVDARQKIKEMNPDVITLDIEMPGMDGLSFLEKIMSLRPMPVVMASTLTQKGADATLRALEIGAVDYIAKPTGTQTGSVLQKLKDDLHQKIRIAGSANLRRAMPSAATTTLAYHGKAPGRQLIAIGSSTGGVEALRDVFTRLPGNLPPIAIVQHMPASFTPSLAVRLNNLSAVQVVEAKDGMLLKEGHAYLAPGGLHMRVVKQAAGWRAVIESGTAVSGHCPSVDILFESVAEAAGKRGSGIILTGMGKDGAAGLLKMREAGARTFGQNAATCVVYGMPKAAMAAGGVERELALAEIAPALIAQLEQGEKAL